MRYKFLHFMPLNVLININMFEFVSNKKQQPS